MRRVEQIRLGVKADFGIVKQADAQLVRVIVHQVMQTRERGELSQAQVVGGENPHLRAPLQCILERVP